MVTVTAVSHDYRCSFGALIVARFATVTLFFFS
jgi:hypothetical protein